MRYLLIDGLLLSMDPLHNVCRLDTMGVSRQSRRTRIECEIGETTGQGNLPSATPSHPMAPHPSSCGPWITSPFLPSSLPSLSIAIAMGSIGWNVTSMGARKEHHQTNKQKTTFCSPRTVWPSLLWVGGLTGEIRRNGRVFSANGVITLGNTHRMRCDILAPASLHAFLAHFWNK